MTAYFDDNNLLQVSNNTNVRRTITIEYIDSNGGVSRTTVSVDAGKTVWAGVMGGPGSIVLSVAAPI